MGVITIAHTKNLESDLNLYPSYFPQNNNLESANRPYIFQGISVSKYQCSNSKFSQLWRDSI